nr:AAA family ATPase [Bradyrhizobium sp. ISRA437]
METRFILISGCSGGGKSTLLAELHARGYPVVDLRAAQRPHEDPRDRRHSPLDPIIPGTEPSADEAAAR